MKDLNTRDNGYAPPIDEPELYPFYHDRTRSLDQSSDPRTRIERSLAGIPNEDGTVRSIAPAI